MHKISYHRSAYLTSAIKNQARSLENQKKWFHENHCPLQRKIRRIKYEDRFMRFLDKLSEKERSEFMNTVLYSEIMRVLNASD